MLVLSSLFISLPYYLMSVRTADFQIFSEITGRVAIILSGGQMNTAFSLYSAFSLYCSYNKTNKQLNIS